MALLSHLGPLLVALVTAGGIGWLVPLVIYLTHKDESTFVASQAKEALNFHISLALVALAAGLSMFTIILIPVAILVFVLLGIASIVLGILAALEASKGRNYRYPLIVRLIA